MAFPHFVDNTDVRTADQLTAWISANQKDVKRILGTEGAVIFRGFPVTTPEAFDNFSAGFDYKPFTYSESLSNAVRINLTPRVFTANEAPADIEIFLHHEMAQTPVFPTKLFFYCPTPAEEGGATPVCRSDLLLQDFERTSPEWAARFESQGLLYTTHMPAVDDARSGQGRSWQSTLSVDKPKEAETRLKELNYTWEWQPDGSLLTTTPALPAVRALADGSRSFFNQVIAAHRGWKRQDGQTRPPISFGNGDPIPEFVLNQLIELSERHTIPLLWQENDIALIDNERVMHGRAPYRGARKRQVLVCLARD